MSRTIGSPSSITPSSPSLALPHLLLRRQLLHSTLTSASHPPVLPHACALPLPSGCSFSLLLLLLYLDGSIITHFFGCRLVNVPLSTNQRWSVRPSYFWQHFRLNVSFSGGWHKQKRQAMFLLTLLKPARLATCMVACFPPRVDEIEFFRFLMMISKR